ncbi:hypothetical protein EVAR_57528_1 [Eumeta japonica]|uniref:Uncharacterized protein n=1 Tax=Eumeta variegata TaxID=151549 RepID=A0A4C1Y2T0_EUMVA|nr:hypothetical protein EVAR_57528_1 [Eumeta japonica]
MLIFEIKHGSIQILPENSKVWGRQVVKPLRHFQGMVIKSPSTENDTNKSRLQRQKLSCIPALSLDNYISARDKTTRTSAISTNHVVRRRAGARNVPIPKWLHGKLNGLSQTRAQLRPRPANRTRDLFMNSRISLLVEVYWKGMNIVSRDDDR